MEVIEDPKKMQAICEGLRMRGIKIKLVPTMGALHAGHMYLVETAHADNDRSEEAKLLRPTTTEGYLELPPGEGIAVHLVKTTRERHYVIVVSIFVNLAQFNDPSDYANYTRTLNSDIELCRQYGVEYVFAPSSEKIYPNQKADDIFKDFHSVIDPPRFLADTLEGASRPGHFQGMLTVVNKLCNITKAHVAYFGEKDYQQLILVKRMSQDLNMSVNIRAVPTVREGDKLPLSSRNIRLNKKVRLIASVIYRLLIGVKQNLDSSSLKILSTRNQQSIDTLIEESKQNTLALELDNEPTSDMLKVDYLEVRCAEDLSKIHISDWFLGFDCERDCAKNQIDEGKGKILQARILTSIILDGVRLLDNVRIELNKHQEK